MANGRAQTVRIRGLRELNRAFRVADRSLRLRWRAEQRAIGEPIAQLAQSLAVEKIRRMPLSADWAAMRVGVTTKVVYVAPRSRNRGGRKRPNLATLLMERAMLPALERRADDTERAVGRLLDRMADDWERA